MERGAWNPVCRRPDDLAWPVRAGRTGGDVTWRVANGPRYEKCGLGLYVPVDRTSAVEQRILEAGARLPPGGCVTGWGALRWRGAAYFDGRGPDGSEQRPVELVIPTYRNMRPWPGVLLRRRAIGPREREVVHGLTVATVARALFDEIVTRDDLWAGVQAIDMTAAARLISVWLFATFVSNCTSRTGAPLVREAASFAVDEALSPREAWLRMVAQVLAGLDGLLVNRPVFDLSGSLIGMPDLFDAVAGLVIEYFGEIHRSAARHRKDVVREELFRSHGLGYVAIVRGDSGQQAAARILAARARAPFPEPESRTWTVEPPPWFEVPETLDAYLERTGQAARLVAGDGGLDFVGVEVPPGDRSGDSSTPGRPAPAGGRRPSVELSPPGARVSGVQRDGSAEREPADQRDWGRSPVVPIDSDAVVLAPWRRRQPLRAPALTDPDDEG